MKIKNKKFKKLFWEIRRHAIILAFYAAIIALIVFGILFIVSIPELIGCLIFG